MRKKLIEAGVEIIDQCKDADRLLVKKVEEMRDRGLSYQAIADIFNLWKVATRTGEGKWYGKTIREISAEI